MAKDIISNRKKSAPLSPGQLAKHQEYVTKVCNTIERLYKQNPDDRLHAAQRLMMEYSTFGMPSIKIEEVSNG